MSWKPLPRANPLSSYAKGLAPVALSGTNGRKAKMCLVLRPALLGDAAWLAAGAHLAVLVGEDEHAGMLRVVADRGGAYVLANAGGRAKRGTLMVWLPWLDGAKPARHEGVALAHKHGRDWLELTLPPWALPPAAEVREGMARAVAAAEAARQKAGYQGVTSRVADPAAVDRARTPRSMGA